MIKYIENIIYLKYYFNKKKYCILYMTDIKYYSEIKYEDVINLYDKYIINKNITKDLPIVK